MSDIDRFSVALGSSGRRIADARETREYTIPDFSNWKDHDSFESGVQAVAR